MPLSQISALDGATTENERKIANYHTQHHLLDPEVSVL